MDISVGTQGAFEYSSFPSEICFWAKLKKARNFNDEIDIRGSGRRMQEKVAGCQRGFFRG